MSKTIRTIKGRVYATRFLQGGHVEAGGTVINGITAPGTLYWKAPAATAQITDDSSLTWMTDEALDTKPGSIITHLSRTLPPGYITLDGRTLRKDTFSDLWAVLSAELEDTDGDLFTLPDARGRFIRALDDGAGVDTDQRKPGDMQACGAPEISGSFRIRPGIYAHFFPSGAFYAGNTQSEGYVKTNSSGDYTWGWGDIKLSAARYSSVYQAGLTEVRPANMAALALISY